METWLTALEQWQIASFFRSSRWGYALLNATHIAGIAMLLGAILPLDLRLLGLWSDVDRRQLARVLVPMAATGLTITATSGLLLFCVRAREYSGLLVFQIKLAIVCTGAAWAIATDAIHGLWLDRRPDTNRVVVGVVSILLWMFALVCGRLIAFFD
jgi:hypothetical protein